MIDPGTGLSILGGAVGSAKVVEKILGPTAEYLGGQLKEWTQKKTKNLGNIFKNAEKKLGDKINDNGSVPPKVLKGILEEGAWAEEEMQVEYFGGVLASSRTGISRDDRGAYFTQLISRLTTYQLRTHYLLYHAIKRLFNGEDLNVERRMDRMQLGIFFSPTDFAIAMDFIEEENENSQSLISHSLRGLKNEGLIQEFQYKAPGSLSKVLPSRDLNELYSAWPSPLGVELFMWAYGHGQTNVNEFLSPSIEFKNEQNFNLKVERIMSPIQKVKNIEEYEKNFRLRKDHK